MKPVISSLALGAFVYCLGIQSRGTLVTAQFTKPSPSPSYQIVSPSSEYPVSSPQYGYPGYSPSPVYGGSPSPSPKYEGSPSPSPKYEGSPSPSPKYEGSPSPSPKYEGSPSPSPQYGKSPVYSPPPVYGESPKYGDSPVYNKPPKYGDSPVYNEPPKYGDSPVYNESPKYGGQPGYGKPPTDYIPQDGYGSQAPSGWYRTPSGDYQKPPTQYYPSTDVPLSGCQMDGSKPTYGKPETYQPGSYQPGKDNAYPGSGNGAYPTGSQPVTYQPGQGNGYPSSYPGSDYPGSYPENSNGGKYPGSDSGSYPGKGGELSPPSNGGITPVPLPPLATNPDTRYKLPNSPAECKVQCVRRSVKEWNAKDFELYGKLLTEMNKRGWLKDLVAIHGLDTKPLAFHGTKAFLPWHRFYLSHFEQLMQQIDHEMNGNRAQLEGEFCLGYWDWGYKADFSNSFLDNVYKYLFSGSAVGTLTEGGIPDGIFKGFTVDNSVVDRSPSSGSNAWAYTQIATCLDYNNYETIQDPSNPFARTGFEPCLENNVHGPVHVSVGGKMAQLGVSPSDPVFWLHHSMVDYLWYVWQKESDNTYAADFNTYVPQPYEKWMMDDAKDYNRFCFNYKETVDTKYVQSPVGTPPPMVGTPPPVNVMLPNTQSVTTKFSALPPLAQQAVTKALKEGEPQVIPREKQTFLRSHAKSEQMFEKMYQEYLVNLYKAQLKYKIIYETYAEELNQVKGETVKPPTGSAKGSIDTAPRVIIGTSSTVAGTPPSMVAGTPPSVTVGTPPSMQTYSAPLSTTVAQKPLDNKDLAKFVKTLTKGLAN